MGSVFVVGSINQDHVFFVERRPRAGETMSGATLLTRPGGKGANQAVAAAASGATVTLLGRVGADPAGIVQRDDLAARGVDVSLVAEVAGAATGSAFVMVTPDGENSVVIAAGANGLVHAADVEAVADRISESAVLVAQLEIPLDAVVEAIGCCGPATHVLLNAAPFVPLPGPVLERIDTIVVNEHEAASFVGLPSAAIADTRTIGHHDPRSRSEPCRGEHGSRRGRGRLLGKLYPRRGSCGPRGRHHRGRGCPGGNLGGTPRRWPIGARCRVGCGQQGLGVGHVAWGAFPLAELT